MTLSLCSFGGRLRDSPSLCTLTSSLMTVKSYLYQRTANDGYLVTVRKDSSDDSRCFGEMSSVDPKKSAPTYVRIEAPLKVIRTSVADLLKKGYKLQDAIPESLKYLVNGYQSQFD